MCSQQVDNLSAAQVNFVDVDDGSYEQQTFTLIPPFDDYNYKE
jgi:hypothetical protein